MLADKEAFDRVEGALNELGKIKAFEEESGKITGHMMILPVDIPDDIEVKKFPGKTPQGFEATFDFYGHSGNCLKYRHNAGRIQSLDYSANRRCRRASRRLGQVLC